MRSTNENFNVFNSRDEIYLVFTKKKSKFSFYLILFWKIYMLIMLQAESQYNVKEDKGVFVTEYLDQST